MDDADLKRVAEAATPGPWVAQGRYLGTPNHMSFVAECRDQNGNWTTDRMSKANATFIATFDPPTVLSLLSRLSAAEARVGVLEAALRALVDAIDYREDEHNRRSYAIITSMPRAFHGARAALTQEPSHEPE
jgi:hypothetical protein